MQTDNAKREKASELIMGLEEGAIIETNIYAKYIFAVLSAVEADG
jgi:hypothetical protein